jgi:UDP-glucose 4-epimerase
VTDLVEAHALLLDYLSAGGRSVTMNCGYGRGYSVRQVIDTVKAVSGVDFKVVEEPRRAGDAASVVARADKVRQILSWKPEHDDLHEIVEAAMSWERYLATRNR